MGASHKGLEASCCTCVTAAAFICGFSSTLSNVGSPRGTLVGSPLSVSHTRAVGALRHAALFNSDSWHSGRINKTVQHAVQKGVRAMAPPANSSGCNAAGNLLNRAECLAASMQRCGRCLVLHVPSKDAGLMSLHFGAGLLEPEDVC